MLLSLFDSIPLDPLLVKARGVDTILAIDGSADTDLNWPNGTALRASYARTATLPDGQQILPYFPSAETFVDQGLNTRPTFFGCNATNAEIQDGMPLVMYVSFVNARTYFPVAYDIILGPLNSYMANAPSGSAYSTNTTTFTLEYSREDTQSFLNSVYDVTTRGFMNSSMASDDQWGTCLACGLVERRRQAANISRSAACETCFDRYCWDAADTQGVAGAAAKAPEQVYEDAAPHNTVLSASGVAAAAMLAALAMLM